ncbi:uncharacterized protein LOC127751170 [Frankliniella occidentalis]|uniref:Uncharacterized protein LOC127751170 n=2 Tax=Frankliniella occidentalis TaxID=133901 RepID=A0A9C6XT38_FRAOC|nr:uncharacterized protein LOC127751170 [Frankliniella occidentalis]
MKRTFNRRRQHGLPTNPKSLEELGDIPDEFRLTLARKQFMCFDSFQEDEEGKRIIVFASKSSLKKLSRAKIWQADGTFDTAPDIFTKILAIHGEYRGETLPLAYALLPDKLESSYRRALLAILDTIEDFSLPAPHPTTFISDLEKGLNNAITALFPNAQLRLCLFHLRQAAFRKVQSLGLQAAYRDEEDSSVRDSFREMVGLAFVPPEDVEECFTEAKNNLPPAMHAFGEYFETTYVKGRVLRGRRRAAPPRYTPALWNQYLAALNNEPRTNNATEAWHNRFQTVVGKSHPTLFHLIKEFKKEEADSTVMMAELDAGKKIRQPQRAKYQRINQRLQRLAESYGQFKEEGRVLEYLRACGHNVGH